jgi:NUMOD3 motif
MAFYTYLYLRENGTPYYVGKGVGRRVFNLRHNVHLPPARERILIQEFPSEGDAILAEKFLIALYGRKDLGTGILRNRTDGGEGVTGRQMSLSTRAAISRRRKGMRFSDQHRAAIALARTGTKATLETREKMSHSRIGKRLPSEQTSMFGKHHREASKAKTAESVRLWWAKKKEGTCLTNTSLG